MINRVDGETPLILRYAERFRCIGSACEDNCCHGWRVPVDRDTYLRYQNLPEGPLNTLIRESVERVPENENSGRKPLFAIIRLNSEKRCPLLTSDQLCRIQLEYGEALLPHTCATYPRVIQTIGGIAETALTLSCPEAARVVLLDPDLLAHHAEAGSDLTPPASPVSDELDDRSPLRPSMRAIRDQVLKIITQRSYPLWQRIFLLGVFCRRLDTLLNASAADEASRDLFAFLAEFDAAVASGALRTSMQTLPADCRTQLDAVLHLAGLMLHKSRVGPRFLECVKAFTAGIGNGPNATLESLAAHYQTAYQRHFAPFFGLHPHILENYLINTIVRLRFPFGRDNHAPEAERSPSRQFALVAAQFALIRGLLIGVAGYYGERFSAEHVVHTVQSASKHFEHHAEFLTQLDSWLSERQLNTPRALTILVNEPAAAEELHSPA
jgi:lysine-N-methylase